jgi:hypothetical protein
MGYAIVWSGTKGWLNLGSVLSVIIVVGLFVFALSQLKKGVAG